MKKRIHIILWVIFLVVLPHSALADMMERVSPVDSLILFVKILLFLAFLALVFIWIIALLVGRKTKAFRYISYTTAAFGLFLCLTIFFGPYFHRKYGYAAYAKSLREISYTGNIIRDLDRICDNSYTRGQHPPSEEQVIKEYRRHDVQSALASYFDYDNFNLVEKENVPQGPIYDSWNTPISFKFYQNNAVIRSAGPDRKFNTDDDLTNIDSWGYISEHQKSESY